MTVEELRHRVRMNLGNLDQQTVPDGEIDHILNECCRNITKEGSLLRASAYATTEADRERYNLPTNILSILRVDYDGYKVPSIEYDEIEKLDVT